ncbi:unnamed protein product [Bursaphelenchus xylophilus]|uniref:tripeptidyl-peptidase II n=1 Tax=Bursaphelenchus xylophilus TaxID=6326 RepID=A0A1I7S1C0_BURXY|nr:unnamed protein product [Bursaphelenchus xylophilus]CAG9080254.1 unnamed protein product [Bursaphelenchus xylophilus]
MNGKGGLEDGKFPIHKLIPKDIVNQPKFLQKHPEFDGRGTVIAILDTGVDLACPGLQVTSTGAPKIIDAVNFTGSGDVITTEIRKPNERNEVIGLTGRTLKIPTSWKNPSNEYRLGLKRVYELYPEDLRSRVKHEKNKKFNEKTEKLIAQVLNRKNQHLEEFGNTTNSVEEQWRREDLRSQMDILGGSSVNDDDGPVLDCIVWHDGEEWRACLDNTFQGDLFKCSPMTDYRKERQWGFLTPEDGLSYCLAIRNNGEILEITTPSGGHGTHCAHIAAAYYPESPKAGGVAPGAQIVSICVGDHRMGGYGSMLAFCRALHYCVEIGVDIINYSYGSVHRMISNSVAVGLLNRLVGQHGIPFFTSAGNEGPILTSMSDPGAQTPLVLCVGAILPEGTDMLLYGDSEERPTRVFEFSSRGPTSEGRLGLSFSAPGTACAGLPFYTQTLAEREDGTSMASPHAVGCAACIISGAKALNIPYSPYKLRLALENTAKIPASPSLTKLDYGHGIIDVDGAFEALQKMDNLSNSLADISVRVFYDSTGGSKHEERGVYIRDAYQLENASDYTVLLEPYFREDKADNATLHNFNIPVRLSSADSYVSYPKNIYLTNNETLFQLKVDHSNLEAGKVYFTEVVGHDASAEPSAGPIFRVPITVIKPLKTSENSLRKVLTLVAGQPERVFLRCPTDATKVAVTLRSLNKNSADLIFCQFAEKVASGKYAIPYKLEPNFEQTFYADVRDRSSFEFCAVLDLHNFDRETRIEVDFRFSGCYLHAFEMQSAAAVGEISLFNALTYDAIRPRMGFSEAATYIRPVSAKIEAANDRVKFMHGAEAYTLTLTYKVQVVEEGSVYFGFLGMDGDFQSHVESLQVMVFFDQCLVEPKQGDHYLQPGEYRLVAQVRHKDQLFLRKLKTATMECRRRIPYTDVKLSETYEGALKYGDQLEYLPLRPGQTRKLYYDGTFVYKLPKWLQPGDCVFGYIYIYEKDLNRNVTLKINGPIIDPTEETDNEMIALVAEEGDKKSDEEGLKEATEMVNDLCGQKSVKPERCT